jgi:hypothetical protein
MGRGNPSRLAGIRVLIFLWFAEKGRANPSISQKVREFR